MRYAQVMRAVLLLGLALAGARIAAAAQPAAAEPAVRELAGAAPAAAAPSDDVPLAPVALAEGGSFVVYGDTRFTDVNETSAANPAARRALVQRIAGEDPAFVVISGDVPWHGNDAGDYGVFREETAAWREKKLRVFPTLGNHEFQGCEAAVCLENWWSTFPEVRGRRWYRVDLGAKIRLLALDSNAALTPGSAQRAWVERELSATPSHVRFLILALHHPLLADQAWFVLRQNEKSLRRLLDARARHLHARLIVCAGHVHNYERFESAGIVHLVSGGGGARPHSVLRGPADRYRDPPFPNFHYLKFELHGDTLDVSMIRLEDPDAPQPQLWQVRDRFQVRASPVP